ncbi:MAG: EAL domain-containing protein [Treponema sp.]|nr:EAL domain-containing protein [Treponema sp.]
MKLLFAAVFLLVDLLLLLGFYSAKKDGGDISSRLGDVIAVAIFAVLSHVFITATTSQAVATIAYSFFYGSINWLLFFFLRFGLAYTALLKDDRGKGILLQAVIILITAMDSIMFLMNSNSGLAFVCQAVDWNGGGPYFITEKRIYFHIHIVYSYILSLLIFLTQLVKMIRTPPAYWSRYLSVILSFLVTVIWDAFFVLNRSPLDFSIVGYAVACVLLLYFTTKYKPNNLINRMLVRIEDSSEDMLIFFDVDGNCIYANTSALRAFGYKVKNLDEFRSVVSDWLDDKGFDPSVSSFSAVCSKVRNGKKFHFEFTYHTLFHLSRPEGSFFHIRDCTKEVNSFNEAYYKATHDSLTDMYNTDFLAQSISSRLKMDGKGWFIVVTDIKGFKFINDLFGKETGDRILVSCAGIIKKIIHGEADGQDMGVRSKVSEGIYGRIGTDRFAVFTKDPEHFKKEFLGHEKELNALLSNRNFPIVVHMGIYEVTNPSMDAVKMFDRANLAIENIKDSYEVFSAKYDDSMRKKHLWENKIIGELDEALAGRQFEMFLQPQADRNLKVCGAEALIRWRHPTEGLLPPSWFLSTFEKNGLIVKLDMFIWEEACKTLKMWQTQGINDLYISVNISPRDFFYIDVYETFIGLVKRYDIPPERLKLEITETAMITDSDRRFVLVDRLHSAGFHVEMDDFGSGYSSLNMLKDIKVDVLKIDMLFLYRAKDVDRSRIIIKQVVGLAKELGITVVTEGVENGDQLKFLLEIGSDIFQGYYFSKPVPLPEFETKYVRA